jgi:hypothetical protein
MMGKIIFNLVLVNIFQFPNRLFNTASIQFLPLEVLELDIRIMTKLFTCRTTRNWR